MVHQQDVQGVVNALWDGGAEAMMLMDQRVISTSAVRCVGNTLILQGRVYSPPYVITAIGNPAALKKALDDSPQVAIYRQYVDAIGLGYDVRTSPERTFPAYAGSINLQNASVPPMTDRAVRWAIGGPRRHPGHRRSACSCSSSAGSCGGPTSRPTAPRTAPSRR